MTCVFPSQSMNMLEFRSPIPTENTPGFHFGVGHNYHGAQRTVYDSGIFEQMDLDIAIDDDGFLEDLSNSACSISSLESPPLSQSGICKSNIDRVGNRGDGGRCAKNNFDNKICGVCGDKALGFNFDAITCESCKAFFRRNALKGLGYFKCPYDERCQMDASNRRFCKRCRLKKCFEIGMKKEYILTDAEKATKRRKIEENKCLKKTSMLKNIKTIGHRSEKLSPSIVTSFTRNTPSDWQQTAEQEWQPTLEAEASSSLINCTTVPLSDVDAATITDLRVAYENSLIINVAKTLSHREQANLIDLVNIAELSVRRVIAMVKQVTSFRTLPQVEQIHLLKGGSIELLIIRSVITYDEEKQHFLDPVDCEETSAVRLDELQKAENGLGLFDEHMKFIRSLVTDLQADKTTLLLLLVISLFSPDRENLTWKDLVSQEQEKYSMLLQNYLQSVHPVPVAKWLYPKLLMRLTDIRNLNEEHSQVLLKVKPEGIQPLMKEVLDLAC